MAVSTALVFDLIGRDRASSAFRSAGSAATAMSTRVQTAGKKLTAVGSKMSRSITLPVVGAGVAAVKMATDFEDSMSKIQGLVGISSKQVEAWSGDILDMAKKLPQSPKELADAMFFITSAGLRGKTALDALNQSARASAAGLGDTATVADAVTSAMNAYGAQNISASKATDILTAAVREGKLEASSLAPVIGKTLPIAKAMGVDFAQVAGAMALMSKSGTNAAQASTQVTAVLGSFAKPSAQMIKALDTMHLSLDGVRKSLADRGMVPTLKLLTDRAKAAGVDLSAVFGNKRALTGVLQLTGNLKETNAVMKSVAGSAGSTDKAFRVASKTAGFQFKAALSSLQVSAIQLGSKLLPAVTSAVNELIHGLDWFSGQPKVFKETTLGAIAFLAVLGPMLTVVGNLTKLYGGFVRVLELTGQIQKSTTATTVAQTAAQKEATVATEAQASATRGMSGAMAGIRFGAAIAGMGALAASTQTSNDKIKALTTVGGAALMGFAAGGPIGAAIGAGAGALGLMAQHMRSAAEAAKNSKADFSGLGDTLDSLTGSVTANTRTFIENQLARSGTLKNLATYGVTTRTAISAILGEGKARQTVSAAIHSQEQDYKGLLKQIQTLRTAGPRPGEETTLLGGLSPKAEAARVAQIKQLQAQADAEKKIIDTVRSGIGITKTQIEQKRKDIAATADYSGKLKGLPRSLITYVKANGVVPTSKVIASLAKQYKLTPKQINTLISATGVDTTVKQIQKVEKGLTDVSRTRPDLSAYKASLSSQIDQAGGIARSGGTAVGNAMASGLASSIHGWVGSVARASADLVSNAINAARRAADAHSPSRKMIKLGEDLGAGLAIGLGSKFVPLTGVIDRLSKYIETQGQKLKSLLSARAGFVGGFQSFTSSVFSTDLSTTATDTLGNDITTPATVADMIAYQKQQRDKARTLKADVARLHRLGLSNALIKQLQASGESGLAQIHTLAGGSRAQIRELNLLNQQTQGGLKAAGKIAGGQLYNAQIAQTRQNEDLAERIAKKLHGLLGDHGKGEYVVVKLDNHTLLTAQRKDKRVRGNT